MNKLLKHIILIFVLFILCSCSIKNDSSISITSDGKVNYAVLIGIDRQLLVGLKNNNVLDDEESINISEYVGANMRDGYLDGFKKEEYSDTQYIGNKYTYYYQNIEDVTSSVQSKVHINDSNDILLQKDLFSKKDDVYTADLVYSLVDKGDYNEVDFINTFSVNLPYGSVSNNADKTINHGRTLIWNINNGEEKEINFSFKLSSNKANWVIASIFFDIIVIVAIFFVRKKVK